MFLLGYNIYIEQRRFSVLIFASSFFCMAFITSVKYIRFTDIRERNLRAKVAEKLETTNDPKVINAIDIFESGVKGNEYVIKYFKDSASVSRTVLQNYIEKSFLDGFLSHFEINMYTYNAKGDEIQPAGNTKLSYFTELVRAGAL
ncbi:MAG: two-component sensor histidine kinase, partial [Rickettsiales bacterium]